MLSLYPFWCLLFSFFFSGNPTLWLFDQTSSQGLTWRDFADMTGCIRWLNIWRLPKGSQPLWEALRAGRFLWPMEGEERLMCVAEWMWPWRLATDAACDKEGGQPPSSWPSARNGNPPPRASGRAGFWLTTWMRLGLNSSSTACGEGPSQPPSLTWASGALHPQAGHSPEASHLDNHELVSGRCCSC